MPKQNHFVGCLLYRSAKTVEVLLVQPIGKGRKKWAIPEVEVGPEEDMAEAARAEIADETGVHVKSVDYLGYVDYPRGRLHCFFGKATQTAEPKRHHLEVRAAEFMPLDQAMQVTDKRQQKLLTALMSTLSFTKEIA